MKLVVFVLAWLYSNCIFLGCHCCPCVKEDVGFYEKLKKIPDSILKDICPICRDLFSSDQRAIIKTYCNHYFHEKCFDAYLQIAGKSTCPTCNALIVEAIMGTGPCGTMTIQLLGDGPKCPGYGCGFISIDFKFNDVYKGPNNGGLKKGKRYYRNETALVPNNDHGLELLGYYIEAFKRRLLFIFGQSVTRPDYWGIVFSSIHFKTYFQKDQYMPFGYSDSSEENDTWIEDTIDSIKQFKIELRKEYVIKIGRQNIGNVIKVFEERNCCKVETKFTIEKIE